MGWERTTYGDRRLAIPAIVGIASILGIIGLAFLLLGSYLSASTFVPALFLLLGVALVSGLVVHFEGGATHDPYPLTIAYEDNRDIEGSLTVSYVDQMGRSREGVLVTRVQARPNVPLAMPGYIAGRFAAPLQLRERSPRF